MTNTRGSANVGELGQTVNLVLRLSGFESHLSRDVSDDVWNSAIKGVAFGETNKAYPIDPAWKKTSSSLTQQK